MKCPDIDFEKHMILAVFRPQRAGDSLSIEKIRENKDSIVATISWGTYSEVRFAAASYTGCHLVAIKKSHKPVQFIREAFTFEDKEKKPGKRKTLAVIGNKNGGNVIEGLQLSLSSEKKFYEFGEQLKINIIIKNLADQPLTVMKRRAHTDMAINTKNKDGKSIATYLPPRPPKWINYGVNGDFTVLNTGETLQGSCDILNNINAQIKKKKSKERHLYYGSVV